MKKRPVSGNESKYTTLANGSTSLWSGYEKEFYLYLNKIRVNPTSVAKDVKEEMKYIDDMIMTLPG
jgi:hypothetical protein